MGEGDGELGDDRGLLEEVPATGRPGLALPTGRDKRAWLLLGRRAVPPTSHLRPVEPPRPGKVGICCSGGGIRSASFNLGALQALRAGPDDRLRHADYLAAVSGGSYIAAAFAMVSKTSPEASCDDSDPALLAERPAFAPGSPEEQYLRNRVSYLAPGGLGKLLLVWQILRGLALNLLFIAAALGIVGALVALYYCWLHPGLSDAEPAWDANGAAILVGCGIAGFGVLAGLLSAFVRLRAEWVLEALDTWSVRLVALGLGLLAIELLLPAAIEWLATAGAEGDAGAAAQAQQGEPAAVVGGGVAVGATTLVGTALVQLRARLANPRDTIAELGATATRLEKLAPRSRLALLVIAGTVIGPLLIAIVFVGVVMLEVRPPWGIPQEVVMGGAIAIFGLLSLFGNATSWSLHRFYRRRLCTAFALKRVKRWPDTDTDADSDDEGKAVARKAHRLVELSKTAVDDWPTLLVCAAANVSDPGATAPGRGVTSLTFSSTAIGGPLVGAIGTAEFEDRHPRGRARDLTLPAAVAMSGAALSPSMGKLTVPGLRLLLALTNVRLGVWIPNPRRAGSFRRKGTLSPRRWSTAPPRLLFKEMLGWSSVNDKFLYVTDGGHYENLGLVELLRRGCTRIYCFDASAGRFGALGDAIALARSELGVEIEFERGALDRLRELGDGIAQAACATATIRYTRGTEGTGTLVYAPTVMTADLPWDVRAFREQDAKFPHHSTADQLFTDQKFEAYRVLGREAGRRAMAAIEAP